MIQSVLKRMYEFKMERLKIKAYVPKIKISGFIEEKINKKPFQDQLLKKMENL